MVIARHVPARTLRQPKISARREVKILAILVKHRIERVAHTIGDLIDLALFHGIDIDGVQVTGKLLGIRDPLAVRRPVLVELWPFVVIGIHELRRASGHVHVPQVQPLIAVRDLLAVGGPHRRIVERWRLTQLNMPHLAESVLLAQLKLVFARLI